MHHPEVDQEAEAEVQLGENVDHSGLVLVEDHYQPGHLAQDMREDRRLEVLVLRCHHRPAYFR